MQKIAIMTVICLLQSASFAVAYVGGRAPGAQLNSTVELRSPTGKGQCTAVKVSEHFVLTAAHCNAYHGFDVGKTVDLINYTGDQSGGSYREALVKNIFIHPSFVSRLQGDYQDYADFQTMDSVADLALIEFDDLSLFQTATIDLNPLKKGEQILVGGNGYKGYGVVEFENYTAAYKIVDTLTGHMLINGLADANGTDLSFSGPGRTLQQWLRSPTENARLTPGADASRGLLKNCRLAQISFAGRIFRERRKRAQKRHLVFISFTTETTSSYRLQQRVEHRLQSLAASTHSRSFYEISHDRRFIVIRHPSPRRFQHLYSYYF